MKISELIEWFEDNGMEDDLEIFIYTEIDGRARLGYADLDLVTDDNGISKIWIG